LVLSPYFKRGLLLFKLFKLLKKYVEEGRKIIPYQELLKDLGLNTDYPISGKEIGLRKMVRKRLWELGWLVKRKDRDFSKHSTKWVIWTKKVPKNMEMHEFLCKKRFDAWLLEKR